MFEKIKELYKKVKFGILKKQSIFKLEAFDYDKLSTLMKESGSLQEFEEQLKNFDEIEQLMQNKTNLHGINHVIRVLFNAYALLTLENLKIEDKKIIIEAAKLHDIGRVNDGEDTKHGQDGALKAEKYLESKGFSKEEIQQICFIIKEHSLPREKNLEDINELPKEIRDKYEKTLNILKDADKLDRCRIGDLDPKRLTTNSAKRLVEISKDNFETNRYSYKKKIEVFPVDEENARNILKQIKEQNEDLEITLEDIKKDYNIYKLMQDENKIEWMKIYKEKLKEKISLNNFMEIISNISIEDMDYLQEYFHVGKTPIICAINQMGINKFLQLKENNKLNLLMHIKNYRINDLTSKEKEDLFEIAKWAKGTFQKYSYLYYYVIKNNQRDLIDILILAEKEQAEYFSNLRGGKNGYKLEESMIVLAPADKIGIIKYMNKEDDILKIKEETNIPLNIILLGLVDLDLLDSELEREDICKLLKNYNRLYLNVRGKKDREQTKTLLLDLPDELTEEEMELVKRCIMGNLRRFKLDSFEQVKNYKNICDNKIIQEFENTDNVEELRKLIIETKIDNIKNLKRDLYFYNKYFGKDTKESLIVESFNKLFETKDKKILFEAYNNLNGAKSEFEFDTILENIRKELKETAKKDVVSKMNEMKEKIVNMQEVERDGTKVIDLTGTDFNLLISVIGSMGSPYIVEWHNKYVRTINRFQQNEALYRILGKKFDFDRKYKVKKMVSKRFKLDPLKNKQRCLSSIDQDFIGHIPSEEFMEDKQPKEKLVLAYFPNREEDIYLMGNHDLMTIYDKERNDPTRKRVPHKDNLDNICNLKLEDLNNVTMGNDNEVVVDSYPGAVICFDKVSNVSKNTAKKHNIPLLYINTREQFQIMKSKIDEYYDRLREDLSKMTSVNDEMFNQAFDDIAKENNIVHRALKMVNGFSYLDESQLPREEILEIVTKMKALTRDFINKCDSEQKAKIKEIIEEETDIRLARYCNRYEMFIDFEEFSELITNLQENTR